MSDEAMIKATHERLTQTFSTQKTKSLRWRKQQLKQLYHLLDENEQPFIDALASDLHRHPAETLMMELGGIKADIIHALTNLETWAAGDKPDAGFLFGTLGGAHLRKEPLGACFIIGAWNFPIYTLLAPFIAALGAGNCAALKPSELAPATATLIDSLFPDYMDTSAIAVLTGGATETSNMLKLKWNHIFYTGGSSVGRIIATAAAKHLTPNVLELGGQSPVIVTSSADIDLTAKRICAAKITNSGQVCLNANHIFAHPSVHDKLIERMIHWHKVFAADNSESTFAHIISEKHFDRITNLLKSSSGEVVYGGNTDRSTKFIQPTIVKDIMLDDSLLSEELFAPIAPVVIADTDRAIRTINSMPHPLGLYIFSRDQKEIDHILDSTTSGGVTINDIAIHAAVPNAPFGGVGESGYGSYHGKYGFDAFSHTRTVVAPPTWLDRVMSFRYPPFDVKKVEIMRPKPGKLIGKKGQTIEEQMIRGKSSATSVIGKALLVVALLAALDGATGGRLLFVHTMRDVVNRFRA